MAPRQQTGRHQRNLNRRMDIQALHQRWCADFAVMPGQSSHATVQAEINRNLSADVVGGVFKIECWESPKPGGRSFLVEDSGAAVQEIRTPVGPVAREKPYRLLNRRRNDVKALFVDLPELEPAGDIRVHDAPPVVPETGHRPNVGSIPSDLLGLIRAPIFAAGCKQRINLEACCSGGNTAKVNRACKPLLGEILASQGRIVAATQNPVERLADTPSLGCRSGDRRHQEAGRALLRSSGYADLRKIEDRDIAKSESHALALSLIHI